MRAGHQIDERFGRQLGLRSIRDHPSSTEDDEMVPYREGVMGIVGDEEHGDVGLPHFQDRL